MAGTWAGAWYGARREVLRSRGSRALVVVTVALTSGTLMACIAGARRTASAFDRFVEWSQPPDVRMGGDAEEMAPLPGDLEASPNVERFSSNGIITAPVRLPDGRELGFEQLAVVSLGSVTERLKVLRGRLPEPSAVDEAIVSFVTADRLGIEPGDQLVLATDKGDLPMEVTGVVAVASEFPTVGGRVLSTLATGPAFAHAHPELLSWEDTTISVWLADVSSAPDDFRDEGDRLGYESIDVDEQLEITEGVNRLLGIEARALVVAGLIAALAGVVVVAQVLRREAEAAAATLTTLRYIGMTRAGIGGGGVLSGALVGFGGSLVGALAAAATSVATPIGTAGVAEPDPGFQIDPLVLTTGVLATTVIVGALGAWAALRAVRPANASPTGTMRLLAGLPEPAGSGVRFALSADRRNMGGRVRPGLIGLGLSVGALVAVVTVGASLDAVRNRPELSGGWWDGFAGVWDQPAGARLATVVASSPDVTAWTAGGWLGESMLDGGSISVMYADASGELQPTMSRGRAPRGPREVALGRAVLDRIGAAIGDEIQLAVPDVAEPISVDVVGETVFAAPIWFTTVPGVGALVDLSFVERWVPDQAAASTFLVGLRDGVDPPSAMAELAEQVQDPGDGTTEVAQFARSPRSDVEALSGITRIPAALAILLAVLAAATLCHRILLTSRRHRRDRAVLRSLGFTPRQTVAASTAQAGTLGVVALLLGIPFGLAAALLAWQPIADSLAVVPELLVPRAGLAAMAAVTLLAAGVLGAVLDRPSRRASPAGLLRSE